MALVAEVILPLAVKEYYSYLLDESLSSEVTSGMRVLVPFGKRKIHTGVVRRVRPLNPGESAKGLKAVEEVLDQEPVLRESHFQLLEWIAFYYMCTPGEVLKAALPTGLKPESALHVGPAITGDWQDLPLTDKEYLLMEAFDVQPSLSFKEVSQLWEVLNPGPRLKGMEEKGYIRIFHQVEEKYKPKYKAFLKVAETYAHEAGLREVLDSLQRAPVQENLMMKIVAAFYRGSWLPKTETLKSLNAGSGAAKALIDKGYIEEVPVQVDRIDLVSGYPSPQPEITLTPMQTAALQQIRKVLTGESPRKPVLLHGVTGSGKTHLYISLIREIIESGKQALYLLPEITLTKQIIERVKAALGQEIGVYHSRYNDHERVEIWQKVRKKEFQVVIGVRSAIFLPFTDLGIIVVDEEHDASFKQHEPAPRYHARDVAIFYAQMLDIPVVLGSATPSFESFLNAKTGKFLLAEMPKRISQAAMPALELVDMKPQVKKKLSHGVFSLPLMEAIRETLEKNEQAILFQNRRGYAPYLVCENCGHIPPCNNCDISLTLHKHKGQLRCHYCGYTQYNIHACDQCGSYSLRKAGIGTEQIEEQARELFPDARIARMDLDTTRGKHSYHKLISQFENREIDLMVGTQMISKGLDFEHVTLVGVMLADHLLSFPDFRTHERAYQLLTQVSGRAGRSHRPGRVIIQSYSPNNPVLQALSGPYAPFFETESPGRKVLGYPPYTRMIRIETRHREAHTLEEGTFALKNLLLPQFGKQLLGPEFALVPRVRNVYRMHMMLKIGKLFPPDQVRQFLFQAIDRYYQQAQDATLRIVLDVDPV